MYSPTQDFCCKEDKGVAIYNQPFPIAEPNDDFEFDGPGVADARGRFMGPISFFANDAPDGTAKWKYMNDMV